MLGYDCWRCGIERSAWHSWGHSGKRFWKRKRACKTKLEHVRVRRVAQGVEDVADSDAEGNVVDQLILDKRTEDDGCHLELARRVVHLEPTILVEEGVHHAGKDLVVSDALGRLGALEKQDNILDADLAFIHLTVPRVGLFVNVLREGDDLQTRLLSFSTRSKVHETGMKLKADIADSFEEVDLLSTHALAVGSKSLEEAGDTLNGEWNEALLGMRVRLGKVIFGFDVEELEDGTNKVASVAVDVILQPSVKVNGFTSRCQGSDIKGEGKRSSFDELVDDAETLCDIHNAAEVELVLEVEVAESVEQVLAVSAPDAVEDEQAAVVRRHEHGEQLRGELSMNRVPRLGDLDETKQDELGASLDRLLKHLLHSRSDVLFVGSGDLDERVDEVQRVVCIEQKLAS